eukprot:7274756-Prymnesium_polylepis.3
MLRPSQTQSLQTLEVYTGVFINIVVPKCILPQTEPSMGHERHERAASRLARLACSDRRPTSHEGGRQ